MVTKRVCELQKGDMFRYMQTLYMVKKIQDGKVWFKLHSSQFTGRFFTFGAKNQMKVEIVDKKDVIEYYGR